MASDDKFTRLMGNVKPHHYSIHLEPDFNTFKFKGNVMIDAQILLSSTTIELYASELDVEKVTVTLEDGRELTNLPFDLDHKWEKLTVKLPADVPPQRVKLYFDFVGTHNDQMKGFYRSSYTSKSGEKKWMVSTQFESTSARAAFPCFDEPSYKAAFDVELLIDENLTALSNTPIVSTTPQPNGKKLVKYGTTPLLSTYLVAFVVGDLEYIETTNKTGTLCRVYTLPGQTDLGKYSLELGAKALDWFTEWFGYKLPLPKCDMIGIPDFLFGAMENWGLVTYREDALLMDPKKTTFAGKVRVATVVAHELSHFWFGDLTTMKWWAELWLKEGFASFMQFHQVAICNPELKPWLEFISIMFSRGMSEDEMHSSHSIEVQIEDPRELQSIYDGITYGKSPAVLRMLHGFLGEERFRDGLRKYVNDFAFKNTVVSDLWASLHHAVPDIDIAKMMSGWIQQVGFPMVTVSDEKLGNNRRRLRLKQQRFIADGSTDESLWHIPITLITKSSPTEPRERFVFAEKEMEIVLEGIADDEWIKLNAQTTGFYRVLYSEEMFTSLLDGVNKAEMSVLDRYGATGDVFAFVKAGYVPATRFLQTIASLTNEDELVVWRVMLESVGRLGKVLARVEGDVAQRFKTFIANILSPLLQRVGWETKEGENPQLDTLRALLIGNLVKAGHKPTAEKALQLFESGEYSPDLRPAIFIAAAVSNNPENMRKLQKIYEECGFAEMETNAVSAMPLVTEVSLLENVIEFAMEKIRTKDLYILFNSMAQTRVGQDFVWKWFTNNVERLLARFGEPNALFARTLRFCIENQCSEEFVAEAEKFYKTAFDENTRVCTARSFNSAIEGVRLNARLLKDHSAAISEYLSRPKH